MDNTFKIDSSKNLLGSYNFQVNITAGSTGPSQGDIRYGIGMIDYSSFLKPDNIYKYLAFNLSTNSDEGMWNTAVLTRFDNSQSNYFEYLSLPVYDDNSNYSELYQFMFTSSSALIIYARKSTNFEQIILPMDFIKEIRFSLFN